MIVDLTSRDFQADEFKNKESRLQCIPLWPPRNIPKGKRSNRRMRVLFVDTMSDIEEERQMQEKLNEGKNSEKCIPIRSEILNNPSESEIEASIGLLNLSSYCDATNENNLFNLSTYCDATNEDNLFNLSTYCDATNEDKALASCLLEFSKHSVRPKRSYSPAEDEELCSREKKKMKTKREKTSVFHGPDQPPELPANFKERIEAKGGSAAVLVIQKKIFDSDVNYGLNRLSIPESKVKNEFLSVEEKTLLLLKDEKGRNKHIEVVMIGPSSPQDEYKINLVKWEMKKGGGKKSSWTYNLVTTWNTIVKDNNLRPEIIVQVWSYRVDSKLHFALVIC